MKARDVMTTGVIAVSESTPVEGVARLMKQFRIGGVPVLDRCNRVLGVLRQEDLFVKERRLPFSLEKVPTLLDEHVDVDRLPQVYQEVRRRAAADVTLHDPVFVDAEDQVSEVVRIMVKRGVPQVFVLEDGELAGVISRVDLVGLMAEADGGQ